MDSGVHGKRHVWLFAFADLMFLLLAMVIFSSRDGQQNELLRGLELPKILAHDKGQVSLKPESYDRYIVRVLMVSEKNKNPYQVGYIKANANEAVYYARLSEEDLKIELDKMTDIPLFAADANSLTQHTFTAWSMIDAKKAFCLESGHKESTE